MIASRELSGPDVAIMLVLCTRINARSGEIPRQHQPSTRRLARDCGYSRDTIRRHLAGLERAGWLAIERPSARLAASEHVTCAYTLVIPPGTDAGDYPQVMQSWADDRSGAGPADDPGWAGGQSGAGPADDPGWAGGQSRAGPAIGHRQTDRQMNIVIDEDPAIAARLARVAIEELGAATRRRLTEDQALEVVRLVLAGRRVTHPEAYLRSALRDDPRRYLPAAANQPPPASELGPDRARQLRERYRYDTANDL